MGSNLSRMFVDEVFILGENENARLLSEGGIIGFLFFFLKFIFSFYCLSKSIKIFKNTRNVLPVYFAFYFTIQLQLGSITG